MHNNLFSLHLKVETERRRMEEMTTRYGRKAPQVLEQSRKLDELIIQLQRRMTS